MRTAKSGHRPPRALEPSGPWEPIGANRLISGPAHDPLPALIEESAVPRRSAEGIELLADPTRRRIVAVISSGLRHPADIASAIGLSRPATSRQLRLLTEAGLLRWTLSQVDRRSRMYVIDPVMQGPIIAWLAGVEVRWARPALVIGWSPPMRVHRLRHDARELGLEHAGFE